MPNLANSLHDRDLGFLKIVAEHWSVDLEAPDARAALPELVSALCERERIGEQVELLPEEGRRAVARLQRSQGRLAWPDFTREFGEVREMGPARRDRERPDLEPVSAAEILWYRALLARGFFDTPRGPREFAYIPDDLLALLGPASPGALPPPGAAADPASTAYPRPASDTLLDQACSLLAGLRLKLEETLWERGPIPNALLKALLSAAGVLDEQGDPRPEAAREFLEAPRGAALALLARAWRGSPAFNELRLLPGLRCEGGWTNDPLHAREVLLGQLLQVPRDRWWDLSAFVAAIRERMPDFQRPAGDYDSWFIRQEASGEYLRGFSSWEEIDGALVRYLITGPLHWLGILDLAAATREGQAEAFRFSAWADSLLEGKAPEGLAPENAHLHVQRDGRLLVPPRAPRTLRYQIARYALWEGEEKAGYRYRITPASLERAREQGLRAPALIHLLRKHASSPPPPAFIQALERWDLGGTQVRMDRLLVLRFSSPEILAALRQSRAARFLGEPLNPTAVIIPEAAREKVLAALAEMGYLAEAGLSDTGDV